MYGETENEGGTQMVYFWAATTILWFAVMTYLSHQNGEETSKTSWILAEDVHRIWARESTEKINAFLRKAAHTVVFFILTILLEKTLAEIGSGTLRVVWTGLLVVWCLADEVTKTFVPGRHFSWLDVGLNLLGFLLGMGTSCIA